MTDIIGGRAARVLLAVVAGVQTHRDLAAVSGVASTSTVTHHLEALRRLGLVSWERHRDGTLRALVGMEPVPSVSEGDLGWIDEDSRWERYRDAAGM